jgi:hypothetical protein
LESLINILLAFFTLASCVLAFVTLSNAYRLRNIMMSWDSGKLFGFPLFASIFLLFTLVLLIGVKLIGIPGFSTVLACYVFMSFNWFISSYYMSKRFITDHGIVKNINDPSQTIPWSHVHDFMERETSHGIHYSFFYLPRNGAIDVRNCIRVDLEVPYMQLESFRKIMEHKLGRRFIPSQISVSGFKQIN